LRKWGQDLNAVDPGDQSSSINETKKGILAQPSLDIREEV
jgi:hypothetical protein